MNSNFKNKTTGISFININSSYNLLMKKKCLHLSHFKIKLFFFFTLIVLNSCEKNHLNNENNSIIKTSQDLVSNQFNYINIFKERNYLYFKTFQDFEQTMYLLDTIDDIKLNIWENHFLGYQSFRSFYNTLEVNDQSDTFLCPLFDESLSTIVNNEGIIRVDSVAFLFDFVSNSIFEVYPVNDATLDSLKLKNEINNDSMYVFRYSMDDAIFFPDYFAPQLVLKKNNGNEVPIQNNKRAFKFLKKWWNVITVGTFGCNEKHAKQRKDNDKQLFPDPNHECVTYKYKLKLKYSSSGLWFKIQAKSKHYKKDGCNSRWKVENGAVCFSADAKFKKMCVNGEQFRQFNCFYVSEPMGSSHNLSSTTYKLPIYSGSTKLTKYSVYYGSFLMYDFGKSDAYQSREFHIEYGY